MTLRTLATFSAALLTTAVVSVQTASAQAAAAQPAPAAGAPAPATPGGASQAALESPGYTYDPQGRRDPFVSLLRRGSATDARTDRPSGITGLEAAEVTLKGTMQSRTGYVALVEAPDKKTYIVKSGDRLADGTVQSITATAMVILQQVHDPLSLEKQREVRKMLRQTDEVK